MGTKAALPYLAHRNASPAAKAKIGNREIYNPELLPIYRTELVSQKQNICKFWIRMARDLLVKPKTVKALKYWWQHSEMLNPFSQNAFNQAYFRALIDLPSSWVVKAAQAQVIKSGKKIVYVEISHFLMQ